ncbi:MAG TPA: phosphatase PAP2 family protein [Ktedonobacterales bacterium]
MRQTIAKLVSAVIHPVALPLVTLVVVTTTITGQMRQGVTLAIAALVLTTVPLAALVGIQVARGRWTDFDVSVREQRYLLYPFGIACAVLMLIAFAMLRAPFPAMATALTMTLANVVNGFINLSYKVSAHAMTASACAALLWLFAPGWGLPAAFAAVLVGWSRVALGRHTTGQVVLGWLVGVASALAIYFTYPLFTA